MIDLVKPVRNVLEKCLNLKEGEDFLMVIDSSHPLRIAEVALAVAHSEGAKAHLLTLPRWPYMQEPSRLVVEAMKACDVGWVVCPIHYTHGHQEAIEAGGRFIDSPFLTEDLLIRLLDVDIKLLAAKSEKIGEILSSGRTLRLSSRSGTELEMSIEGQHAYDGTSVVSMPGERGFLPPAVAGIVPVTGTANGQVVINGSLRPAGLLQEPVILKVENGRIVEIKGGASAQVFRKYLESYSDENAFSFPAHIGPGCNPKAQLTGNILEDERVEGLVSMGIGSNVFLPGGDVEAATHTDGTVTDGTLTVDGKEIVRDGRLVV